MGQHDRIALREAHGLSCATPDAVSAREASRLSARTCLSAYVLSGAGHAVNVSRDASAWLDYASTWRDTHTASRARPADPS